MRGPLDHLAIAGLHGYRRFISPYKGFRCAYGVVFGGDSCSDVALHIARRFGVARMVRLLPLQAARCRHAMAVLKTAKREREERSDQDPNERAGDPGSCKGAGPVFCVTCCDTCWW
jgi:putative component of membrane protein insertase Oxa1/YidC/SpoIIIJ protein YidD